MLPREILVYILFRKIWKITPTYMNLNKRGGLARASYKKLQKYVEIYRLFLIRKMELFAPEVIVFCGCYDGVAEKLFQLGEEEKGGTRNRFRRNETAR